MKKHILLLMMAMVSLVGFVSCGDDADVDPKSGETNTEQNSFNPTDLEKSLFGTSWKISTKIINASGTVSSYFIDKYSSITLTDEKINPDSKTKPRYYFYYKGKLGGTWYEDTNKGDKYLSITPTEIPTSEWMEWINAMGTGGHVYEHSSSELKLENSTSTSYTTLYIYKASSSEETGNNGGTIEEPPYIAYYNFTATKTSVTVEFEVLNDVRITSAKVKYGTTQNPSSTVNASIIAKHFKATISGLKSGTTYYVRGVATGSNGKTGQSDVIKVITQY